MWTEFGGHTSTSLPGFRRRIMKRHPSGMRDTMPEPSRAQQVIIHLAFYAGRPKAMSAIQVAKRVFAEDAS